MVVIRLSRTGANKRPFYHIVVTDSREARDSGRYIERIGYYNPNPKGQDVPLFLEKERIEYWTSKGAQLSDTVNTLVKEFTETQLQPQSAPHSKKPKKTPAATKEATDAKK